MSAPAGRRAGGNGYDDRRRRRSRAPAGAVAVLLAAACAPAVDVRTVHPATTLRQQLDTRLTSGRLSRFTINALGQLDMRAIAERDPRAAIARLIELADAEPDAPWRMAAAELLLDAGEATHPADPTLYLACARQADLELHRAIRRGGGLLDARTEFAGDLYHRAVSRFLTHGPRAWLAEDVEVTLDGAGGHYVVHAPAPPDRRRWDPRVFDSVTPSDALHIRGMRNHHRLDAYGTPVVAIREQEEASPPRAEPFMPPEGEIYPATVTLDFLAEDRVAIELWHPDHVRTITRYGAALRLSTDTTAPIAVLFARTELGSEARGGLFHAERYLRRIGIYMHEPFDPHKIPVLMIHGLFSSPLTWRDMLNDLRADPQIRSRYQFWMFLYPTGLPVARSAAYLRDQLARVRARCQEADAPALQDLVVIGHSMGGLLSKALVQNSGDRLWHSLHPDPFDAITAPPAVRDHLAEVFFYDADPAVSRIVFIATPHGGSPLARSVAGRLGDSFIRLPAEFADIDAWLRAEAGARDGDRRYQIHRGVPTSIDDLQPDAPHLLAYQATPLRAGIALHSIIGAAAGDSDGIVPVTSARIPGVESELVIDAHHDAHTHPLAIREVRRILLVHASGGS